MHFWPHGTRSSGTLAQALGLARELAAHRASAVPVSLAASRWPGGGGADGENSEFGDPAADIAARRDLSHLPAAALHHPGNGSASEGHVGEVLANLTVSWMQQHSVAGKFEYAFWRQML
jgi:hypothetical protein